MNPFSCADLPVESMQIEATVPARITSSILFDDSVSSSDVFTKAFSPNFPGISIILSPNALIWSIVSAPFVPFLNAPTSLIVCSIPTGSTSSL